MIIQQAFMDNLKEFGLNSYEAKLWTSLLSRGVSTAGELSDIANVPRSRSYDVLESLEKKGFIILKLGKPIKYIAVPPVEVVERIKKKVQDQAVYKETQLEKLKSSDLLNELEQLYTKGIDRLDPADLTGAVKGRTNMYAHLSSMIKDAKHSVDIITTKQGLGRKLKAFKKQLQKAKKKGVIVRMLAPTSTDMAECGEFAQVRTTNNTNFRMCLIDKKQILLMVVDDQKVHPSYDFGIWVHTDYFMQFMQQMFDKLWTEGKE